MRTLLPFFIFISVLISCSQQEDVKTTFFYSHENIMPNDKDSIPFVFTRRNDTIIARIALFHSAHNNKELTEIKESDKWGTYLFEGRKLYDGRTIVHRLADDYFCFRNDTLYHITTKYSVSLDSIRSLYASSSNYKLIDSIADELSYQGLDTLFSINFFEKDKLIKKLFNNDNCFDVLKLRNYWTINQIGYYQFSIKYNCDLSQREDWYIINDNFDFHGFNTKYYSAIGRKLKNMNSELDSYFINYKETLTSPSTP